MEAPSGDAVEAARRIAGERGHPLSQPVRLAVMLLLAARGPLEFNSLKEALGVTPGNLWTHVNKLRDEGYVRVCYRHTPLGPRAVVEPTEKGLRETLSFVESHVKALREAGLGVNV